MGRLQIFFYLITLAVLEYYEDELKWYEASEARKIILAIPFPLFYLFAFSVGLFFVIKDYYDFIRDSKKA